jgi:hypothetical protein
LPAPSPLPAPSLVEPSSLAWLEPELLLNKLEDITL